MDIHLKRNDKLSIVDEWTDDKYEVVRADFELRLRKL